VGGFAVATMRLGSLALLATTWEVHSFVPRSSSSGRSGLEGSRWLGSSAMERAAAVLPSEPDRIEISMGEGVEPLRLETGRIGRQADAAVMARRGDTMVYTTLCIGSQEGGGDFVPLSVEYQERHSATGRTSTAGNRREGRPADKEILISRLIDRPLRPTIAEGWCNDIQIVACVVSFDGVHAPDTLAILGASAALQLSQVPTTCAVGASRVTKQGDELVLDATIEGAKDANLSMVVAGAAGSVLMVEGGADFLPEADVVAALGLAQDTAARAGAAIGAWADSLRAAGKRRPKAEKMVRAYPASLEEAMDRDFGEAILASTTALTDGDMTLHREVLTDLENSVLARLEEEYAAEPSTAGATSADAKRVLKKLCEKAMTRLVREDGRRCDGRAVDQVRPIDIDMTPLPAAHGSAIFTRGETQSLATCTLGSRAMALRNMDALDEERTEKKFYLQYSFPPASVGETGRIGAPGRREVGHGALAERALAPAMPDEAEFDYAVRVESLITESCGSSSMASVCGGSLALMDAGVPLARTIAGVAMGVLLEDPTDPIVLTDILGVEDALGSMDFKVAGDSQGISAFQLDVKTLGLGVETLAAAIERARTARLHVIGEMEKACAGSRSTLAPSVPRQKKVLVPPSTIGKLIGAGGRTINSVIEECGVSNIDVNDKGEVVVSSTDDSAIEAAIARVTEICAGGDGPLGAKRVAYDGPMPEVNETYSGAVTDVKSFGAFMSFDDFPGLEGLCHISELHVERVRSIDKFIQTGRNVTFKVIAINPDTKKLSLSRKAVLLDQRSGASTRTSPTKLNDVASDEQAVVAGTVATAEDAPTAAGASV